MVAQMLEQQFADALGRLLGGKMRHTRQHLEAIGGGDEIGGAFGGGAADCVVGIAPDIECRHADRTEG